MQSLFDRAAHSGDQAVVVGGYCNRRIPWQWIAQWIEKGAAVTKQMHLAGFIIVSHVIRYHTVCL